MSRMSQFGSRLSRFVSPSMHKERLSRNPARRLFFEPLEDRRVLACTGWTIGATGTDVTATLSNNKDIFYASEWTHPTAGVVLGIWNGDPNPCWNSGSDSTPPFTANDLTSITVDALAGDDEVHLEPMDEAAFPAMTGSPAATVWGWTGNDQIWGSWAKNLIYGGSDEDTIRGGGSNDDLRGGPENDTIYGGAGNDEIQGNEGNDTIYAEAGQDGAIGGVHGNDGDDTIYGGSDNDYLYGDAGQDRIFGQDGEDYLWGGTFNDFLSGGNDRDHLFGESETDVVDGNAGNDAIDGGDGADYLWSNGAGLAVDQPWNGNGQGTPGWDDMVTSGPNTDGDCDLEDAHPDEEAGVCGAGGSPRANNDAYSVSHFDPAPWLLIGAPGVLSNDLFSMPPGATVTWTAGTFHSLGATLGANGGLQYRPNPSYVGKDAFYYQITSGAVTSPIAGVVVIDVTNAAPVAYNDGFGTYKNVPVTKDPISPNDLDADYNEEQYAVIHSVTQPPAGQGAVTFVPGSRDFTYTPPNNWTGTATFKYRIVDTVGAVSNEAEISITVTNPLMLDLPSVEPTGNTRSITDADLALLAAEAARRWVAAGVDPITAERALAGTDFVVQDLPGSMLGLEVPGTIIIDVNAAGYGWFVDSTPDSDEEFSIFVTASEQQAGKRSPAFGKVDLLTALEHEFGHALGMDHPDGDPHSVMHETLSLSTRRIPTAADIMAADEYYASLGDGGSLVRRRW